MYRMRTGAKKFVTNFLGIQNQYLYLPVASYLDFALTITSSFSNNKVLDKCLYLPLEAITERSLQIAFVSLRYKQIEFFIV